MAKSLIKDGNNELYTFKNKRWDKVGTTDDVTVDDFETSGIDDLATVHNTADGRTVKLEYQRNVGDKKSSLRLLLSKTLVAYMVIGHMVLSLYLAALKSSIVSNTETI